MRWYAQTQSGNSETPAPASAPSLPEPSPEVKPAELPDRTDQFSAKEAPTKRRTPGQLRKVLLPLGLVRHFVRVIAAENTAQNVETCALLLGRLSGEAYTVSHLLVPEQSGTSETCSMRNEQDVASLQQALDLLTLGWIHTHPSQSIFLSSLDLHTHAAYQRLLPEAIAVVCSPREGPEAFGVFRMTDPPGLECVLRCREEGAFHPQ
ncbi:hypothetical protein JCM8202v2_005262 [Rhodotorula sphaerocarpa]